VKLLIALLVVGLVGCASRGQPTPTITYEQLKNTRYTTKDCGQIDYHINRLEAQLKARGLLNTTPEELNEDDRMYNATARILVWNLRIDCNNPNRFSK
jgi:hypothetical protein